MAVNFLAGNRSGPVTANPSLELCSSLPRELPKEVLPLVLPSLEEGPYRCTWIGRGDDDDIGRVGELDCCGAPSNTNHGEPPGEGLAKYPGASPNIFSVGGNRPLSLTSSSSDAIIRGMDDAESNSNTAASHPPDLLRGRRC